MSDVSPALVCPFHSPDGSLFGHLDNILPRLKATFSKALLSITPATTQTFPRQVAALAKNSFFKLLHVPSDLPVGNQFRLLYEQAAWACPPGQILHLCFADRLAYILQSEHRAGFIRDMQAAIDQHAPLLFQRSRSAWATHPRNYADIERCATTASEHALGQSLDFAWCHLAIQAAQLREIIPCTTHLDLSLLAEMILLIRHDLCTKDVDWLAWEDPFLLSRQPEELKAEREQNPAEARKRLSYVIPTLQAIADAALIEGMAPKAPKAALPCAFPDPGLYAVSQLVTLRCATAGARIFYTSDGSTPTTSSDLFDPNQPILVEAVNDGEKGLTRRYSIRAMAIKEGMLNSDLAELTYTIARRDRDAYRDQVICPDVIQISDYDNDRMFLVLGSERALLIDAGFGSGDLRQHVKSLAGSRPLAVAITHAHPDHLARLSQFQPDHEVFMHLADLPLVDIFIRQLGFEIDPTQIKGLTEGFVFDLGDRKLKVYLAPGHSPGCIVLLDEERGILFSGDAVGSNRPAIVDTLWMQLPGMAPIDAYLSTLQTFRAKVEGKIQVILTGHNDTPIWGETYLDNLQQAAQNLVDEGEAVLIPSLRPTSAWQVVVGDRLTDPNWAAINVNRESCLSAPAQRMATLSQLRLSHPTLEGRFNPFGFNYTAVVGKDVAQIGITPVATSCKYRSIMISREDHAVGAPIKSGETFLASLAAGDNLFQVTVTAPDGINSNTYTLLVRR